MASAKLTQADLESMQPDDDAFRGGEGVWTKEQWLRWLRTINEQLYPAPATNRPTPVIL